MQRSVQLYLMEEVFDSPFYFAQALLFLPSNAYDQYKHLIQHPLLMVEQLLMDMKVSKPLGVRGREGGEEGRGKVEGRRMEMRGCEGKVHF